MLALSGRAHLVLWHTHCVDSPTMVTVLLVTGAVVLFACALVYLERRGDYTDGPVAVHIRRRGSDWAIAVEPRGTAVARIAENGIVSLRPDNRVLGGDGLWTTDTTLLTPVTVVVSSAPGHLAGESQPDERRAYVNRDQGAAVWFRWSADDATGRAGAVVALLTDRRRTGGKRPKVLFNAAAEAWISHFLNPEAVAPPEKGAEHRSGEVNGGVPSQVRFTSQQLRWFAFIIGTLAALTSILVILDIVGVRRLIPLSSSYDWLAFAGAILGGVIGGLVTLVGVYLTLQHASESERSRQGSEDLRNRLSVMPVLQFRVSYDPKVFDNSEGQLAEEPGIPVFTIDGGAAGSESSFEFPHDLIVSNVGSGHARIDYLDITVGDNRGTAIQAFRFGLPNYLVQTGGERHVRMYFLAPRNNPRFGDPRQNVYAVVIEIGFEDVIGNSYKQLVHTSFAKGLSAEEDPLTGGQPYSSFGYAEPAMYSGSIATRNLRP